MEQVPLGLLRRFKPRNDSGATAPEIIQFQRSICRYASRTEADWFWPLSPARRLID
jgi:hypothetical protein